MLVCTRLSADKMVVLEVNVSYGFFGRCSETTERKKEGRKEIKIRSSFSFTEIVPTSHFFGLPCVT